MVGEGVGLCVWVVLFVVVNFSSFYCSLNVQLCMAIYRA